MNKAVFRTTIVLQLLIASIFASNCISNTQLILGNIFCYCDHNGQWSSNECETIERNNNLNLINNFYNIDKSNREICLSKLKLQTTCAKCICHENGTLACNLKDCLEYKSNYTERRKNSAKIGLIGPWCKPYSSYYVNCKICVCPSSGRISEANCVIDNTCTIKSAPQFSNPDTVKKLSCAPKIMYVFECLSCICSDNGTFVKNKCIQTCPSLNANQTSRECIPNTFFEKNCSICYCTENGEINSTLCTKAQCSESNKIIPITKDSLRSKTCTPFHFTEPSCYYFGCQPNGVIDKQFMVDSECTKNKNVNYDVVKETCTPGEMIPFCNQCFCLKNQTISLDYCSEGCSFKKKINVLDKVLNDSEVRDQLIDKTFKGLSSNDLCSPNSVYIDQGKYCICPENGLTNFKICSLAHAVNNYSHIISKVKNVSIDFNVSCTSSTYVDFDCNSCFCSKEGKIDPKWCTYDDCDVIKTIKDSQRMLEVTLPSILDENCIPGTISKLDCNYCICPKSGYVNESVCTKTECLVSEKLGRTEKFTCDPLEYYMVDCNICFCPSDGIKNLAKCTKKSCFKSFLRSDSCTPRELFSDDCNVCICPESGDKNEKACFNNNCPEGLSPWKKIFELTDNSIGKQNPTVTRNLDYCFPGEEFIIGCQLCVCPDMGIKSYAVCTNVNCDESNNKTVSQSNKYSNYNDSDKTRRKLLYNIRSNVTREIDDNNGQKQCNPGSMYILKCKECICPYMGSLSKMCRKLPSDFHCEQPYPYINYVPFNRRHNINNTEEDESRTKVNAASPETSKNVTRYRCDGKTKHYDSCFICECTNEVILLEKCFKNEEKSCADATPSFLSEDHKIH